MTDINSELAEALGKLLVSIVFSFIVRPLAMIYGLNLLLAAVNLTRLPYSFEVYMGVLLTMIAVNLRVTTNE